MAEIPPKLPTARDTTVEDRSRIESDLLAEAAHAKQAYESAKEKASALQETSQDLGLTHPDGISAISQAVHVERTATRRYADAIKALSEFVLESKVPKGRTPPKARGAERPAGSSE